VNFVLQLKCRQRDHPVGRWVGSHEMVQEGFPFVGDEPADADP
jgi:hypothetical protein